jgi:hypothetical protein
LPLTWQEKSISEKIANLSAGECGVKDQVSLRREIIKEYIGKNIPKSAIIIHIVFDIAVSQ